MKKGRQIVVPEDVYERLAKIKVHPREPFGDVVRRLLDFYESRSQPINLDQSLSKPIEVAQPQSTEVEQDRPATPAQVETIWNIAWEIASWNDVKDVVSKLVGFPVPDDPSQLTVSQASRVIEALSKLNRKPNPRQAKAVKRLLKKLAERENLKPEEVADKYNVPSETSKLRRYHLELLRMLAGEAK
jgi:negative regulator of replication initiation